MNRRVPPKPKKFPAAKQRRLDELLEKDSAGNITGKEKARLEQLVAEAEQLMVANAKLLAQFSQTQDCGASAGAVPVTVWVRPEYAEHQLQSRHEWPIIRLRSPSSNPGGRTWLICRWTHLDRAASRIFDWLGGGL